MEPLEKKVNEGNIKLVERLKIIGAVKDPLVEQEYLRPAFKPNGKALDVGSGSGILCVCFKKMMGKDGKVYGIEHIDELVEDSIENIGKHHKEFLDDGSIKITVGDGRKGLPEYAPYDVIHVGAAAEELPKALVEQLAPGGIMMIPVGKFMQEILLVHKDAKGGISQKSVLDVRYVPLTSKEAQMGSPLKFIK